MIDKMFSKVGEVMDSLENRASQIKDNLVDMVPEINIDLIEEKLEFIGYRIPRVEIAVTIPPRIAFEIDLVKSVIDPLKQEAILNESFNLSNNDITQRVLIKIIQGLDSAFKLREKLHFKNKKLSRISVEGSLIPTVKLIYLDSKEIEIESKLD